VSVAVASAVLDVIENEKLHEQVVSVSDYLVKELLCLKEKHSIIGDIRGYGLFIGIDFVKCRKTREPASEVASHLLQRMRDEYILLSLDGPYVNVMKIKPPLIFDKVNAKLLVNKLDKILYELHSKSKI
jgi:ethanolamine-phosphate phospho-lyase